MNVLYKKIFNWIELTLWVIFIFQSVSPIEKCVKTHFLRTERSFKRSASSVMPGQPSKHTVPIFWRKLVIMHGCEHDQILNCQSVPLKKYMLRTFSLKCHIVKRLYSEHAQQKRENTKLYLQSQSIFSSKQHCYWVLLEFTRVLQFKLQLRSLNCLQILSCTDFRHLGFRPSLVFGGQM